MVGINLSPVDLKEISREHLSYEIEMFKDTIARLKKGDLDQLEKNVMLESFLIHARCLYDFLYPTKDKRKDDVVADDYFEDPKLFRDKIPKKLEIESYLKRRTGKEIAHLSYERLKLTPEKKSWNIGNVHDQIMGVFVVFFECLSSEQRGWFRIIVS